MSTLELDRTDPGIEEMVVDWKNGAEYELRVKVRQNTTDAKSSKFEVIEAVNETAEAPEEGEYPEEKPKGKKMGKPAIMIAFSNR